MKYETAFEMATANIRFGPGVTREVGMDLADCGAKRVMLLTDPNLSRLKPVATVIESLERKVQYMGYYQRNFNNIDMATL